MGLGKSISGEVLDQPEQIATCRLVVALVNTPDNKLLFLGDP